MAKVVREKPTSVKASGVLSRIAPIKKPVTGLTVNIYGRSGTGKTTLACTFPKPLLLIGAEDGTRSVYNVKGVDFIKIEDPAEMLEVVEDQRKKSKYKSVVLDAATSYQDHVLRDVMGHDLPAQLSFGTVSRDQWGQVTLNMKEHLSAFFKLALTGTNTILLAQEREFKDDDETKGDDSMLIPLVQSSVSPGVAAWLPAQVDYLIQTMKRIQRVKTKVKQGGKELVKIVDQVQYVARTGPHPVYLTKFRVPQDEATGKPKKLPDVVVDPTFPKLLALMEG